MAHSESDVIYTVEFLTVVVCVLIYLLYWCFKSLLPNCCKSVHHNHHNMETGPVSERPEPVTYLTIPPTPPLNHIDHGMIFPGTLHTVHAEAQISPPPYSAVALPPSYDDAIKQTTEENRANSSSEENKY